MSSISLKRISPCIFTILRRTMGSSMKRMAKRAGGKTPLMMAKAGLQVSYSPRCRTKAIYDGRSQIQARKGAVVQSVSTLETIPTKATGMAQMMINPIVKDQEMMVWTFRW